MGQRERDERLNKKRKWSDLAEHDFPELEKGKKGTGFGKVVPQVAEAYSPHFRKLDIQYLTAQVFKWTILRQEIDEPQAEQLEIVP